MRAIRFTFGQLLLIVIVVLGTAAAVRSGVQLLLPSWQTPGLLALLALVGCDAVATQSIVTRQRLNVGEQVTLRATEWLLIVVAVRFTSSVGETVPVLQLIEPWLRDPLAFFGGRFGEYLVPTFCVWFAATLLTDVVLRLEAEPPSTSKRGGPNDEAAAMEERAVALARFDRYWLVCVGLALLGASAALYQTRLLAAVSTWSSALPLLGVLGSVFAGFMLHSQGQFSQLRYGWQMRQAAVATDIAPRWHVASWLLTTIACVLGVLLGSAVLLAPPPPLIPVLNALFVVLAIALALVVAVFGLILLPFAWLLSLLMGTSAPSLPRVEPIMPPQIPVGPTDRPLLPALIFWACVVLLVVVAALRYVQQRQELRAVLGRWRGTRWLLVLLDRVWRGVQTWSTLAIQTVRQQWSSRTRPTRQPRPRVIGSQAQLQAVYRRLLRAAARRGVHQSPSQTPHELRAAVGSAIPTADADTAGLTDVYVRAAYGPISAQPGDVRRARAYWRRLERIFARAGRAGQALSTPASEHNGSNDGGS